MAREARAGWWEEYGCGCVSDTVRRKKDLLGYCKYHGNDRRRIHRELPPGFWDDPKPPKRRRDRG